MDALIIAAGYGSRIAGLSDSKPLTLVAGVPLIELGVRQAAAAGVTRVVVVTGHQADKLEAFLADLAARSGVTIDPVRLSDWSTPNGYSVMAGAARIDGDFLLLMADHIFVVPLLKRLIDNGSGGAAVTLAVDRRLDNPLVDPDDATWVETDAAGRIRAIGKTIAHYDAVDCGAFLATQALPRAIAEAIAAGKGGSLSDGMQVLADRGDAATLDIGTDPEDSWWLDVDDPHFHAIAEAEAPRRLTAAYA